MSKISQDTIAALRGAIQVPGGGHISAGEAVFLQDVIHDVRPKLLAEIGVASGLSSLLFCKFTKSFNTEIHGLDLLDYFYADREKKIGFIADAKLEPAERARVTFHPNAIATRLGSIVGDGRLVDFLFIDANHQHPWPTIDFASALPFMRRGGIVAFHDLQLYKQENYAHGIGPRILFDQLVFYGKKVFTNPDKTLFYCVMDEEHTAFATAIKDALLYEWTLLTKLKLAQFNAIEVHFKKNWPGSDLASYFRSRVAKRYGLSP